MTSTSPSADAEGPVPPSQPVLVRGDASSSLELLVRSLDDPNWRVRREAAQSLGRRGDREATAIVLQELQARHANLRVLNAAVGALAQNGVDVAGPLAELLHDSDADLRIAAALTLGERRDPQAISALLGALEDRDVNVRFHVIEALGKLRAGIAVDALIAIAESRDFSLAPAALEALGTIGDGSIATRLIPLLDDVFLQGESVRVLGRLGDAESVKPMIGLLESSPDLTGGVACALVSLYRRYDEWFRRGDVIVSAVADSVTPAGVEAIVGAAIQTPEGDWPALATVMGWIDDERVHAPLIRLLNIQGARAAAQESLIRKGPSVSESLVGQLTADDPETRRAALAVLGKLGDRRQVPALRGVLDTDPDLTIVAAGALALIDERESHALLINLLGHQDASVRQAAVSAIRVQNHPDTPGDITRLLADGNPLMRESAVALIGELGDRSFTDSLVARCHDENENVRCLALETLAGSGDLRILSILAEALRSNAEATRAAAARGLGQVNAVEAWPLLLTALDDAGPWVRYFAVRSTGSRQQPAAAEILTRMAEFDSATQVRVAAIDALAAIGADSATPLLVRLNQMADDDQRQAALNALGALGNPEGLLPLLAAIESTAGSTRLTAIRALGGIRASRAVEKLSEIAATDPDQEASAAALEALGRAPGPQSAEALISLAAYPACRDTCIAALARIDARHLEGLAAGLQHENGDVRCAIVQALARHPSALAKEFLSAALNDPERWVRRTAITALAVVSTPRSRQEES